MRVLHIIDGIGPPAARGTELIYDHLKRLSEEGVAVDVLTLVDRYTSPDWLEWTAEQERQSGIRVYGIDIPIAKHCHMGYLAVSRMLYCLYAWVLERRNRYDIINDFSSSALMFNRTALIGLFARARMIHTLCTFNTGVFSSRTLLGGAGRLDGILCLSESLARAVADSVGDRGKVAYLRMGVETGRFSNRGTGSREKLFSRAGDRLIVLYIGPIEPRKGIFALADASRILSGSLDLHFVFACARFSSRKDQLRKTGELEERMSGCRHSFEIIAGIADVAMLLDACDMVVVPQLSPHGVLTYPATLLEAMAAGRAIVASNTQGIDELIADGKNGMLFTPGSSVKLAGCIRTMAESPELRHELGERARLDVDERHDMGTAVAGLISVYRGVMRDAGASSIA